ncbi:class I SAM-dependent methyltransferase [Lachnospiraceae bacterium 54-53]
MFKNFFQNTRKPQGMAGTLMLHMMNSGHRQMAGWGFTHISPKSNISALDIGCGGGANLSALLKLCPGGRIAGMDYSSVSVNNSRKKNRKSIQDGRLKVVQGNVASIPFPDESFHLATAFETIYFWPDPEASFKQVHRVLKPGGTFLICNETCDSANDQWTKIIEGMTVYSREELDRFLKNAGFSSVKADIEPKKGWICITAEKKA